MPLFCAAIDTGSKKQAYRRNGVLEYIVWQSFENQLDCFYLVDGDYQQFAPDDAGVIRSQVFPGLWLAVNEVLSNRMVRVLEVLQAGIHSPEHRTFVEQLAAQQSAQ